MEVKRQQFPDWHCPCSSEPMKGSRSGMRISLGSSVLWCYLYVMKVSSKFCLQSVDGGFLISLMLCSNSGPAKGLWKPNHMCHWVSDVCWGLGITWSGWLSHSCNSLTGVTFKGNQLSQDQRLSELDGMMEIIEPKLLPGSQTLFTTLLSYGLSGLFSLFFFLV